MSARSATHRLFFALWPAEALRARIEQGTRHLVEASGGRAIPPRNFHITLAFVGSVPQADLGTVREAGAEVRATSFELALALIEALRSSRVLCLTPRQAPAELIALSEALHGQLKARRFVLQERAFRPHLTLAREVPRPGPSLALATPLEWAVREFVLVESLLLPQGSSYSLIERWPLAKTASIQ